MSAGGAAVEYTIKFSFAMFSDVVPLVKVAEAMALHKATGGGAMPWTNNANLTVKPHYEELLANVVRKSQLQVCDQFGKIKTISEIFAEDCITKLNPDTPTILTLYAKAHHLNQWGATNGDTFKLEDTGVEIVELTNGIGILEKHEPEVVTVDTACIGSALTTATNTPLASETKEQRQDRRLQECVNAGLSFDGYKGRLPNGVGTVAASSIPKVSRQAFSVDIKAALLRRENARREGVT
jgi:hypothetical protein